MYHINPETKRPNKCKDPEHCKIAKLKDHYATSEEAREALGKKATPKGKAVKETLKAIVDDATTVPGEENERTPKDSSGTAAKGVELIETLMVETEPTKPFAAAKGSDVSEKVEEEVGDREWEREVLLEFHKASEVGDRVVSVAKTVKDKVVEVAHKPEVESTLTKVKETSQRGAKKAVDFGKSIFSKLKNKLGK